MAPPPFAAASHALPAASLARSPLPPSVEAAVWHASELGASQHTTSPTGWSALDDQLPGGGWPGHALTEILAPQPAVLEWRLLGPALGAVVSSGRQVVVIGPPRQPHLPGLRHAGIDERHLVWIQAEAPAERLWVTEQLIKSNSAGALVAWLPQARQEQLRRLQVCAQTHEGLVFLCRPEAARHQSSAAPLRVLASVGVDWELHVHVFKRRGPVHDHPEVLPSVPGGLDPFLTPRLRRPSRLISREVVDVVGSPAVAAWSEQRAAVL